jgi:L-glyceraldehyde 3-phosphate reductase
MSEKIYVPSESRYTKMFYNRCGASGLHLPPISLGLWHNFGYVDDFDKARNIILQAFDRGITHFDLANNYGPPYGSAESNFGRIMNNDLRPYRDEMVISSKAGFDMWPGPYGNWGSRKYLIASCDQSLKRMGVEYVDIFYHHRPDPETPLEETMGALSQLVKDGKALYVGVSRYSPELTRQAVKILKEHKTPFIIHQPKYSMFVREPEKGLFEALAQEGLGSIAFSPLAEGLLTNKYLEDIPEESRASKSHGHLQQKEITKEKRTKLKKLNELARERGQSLAQMALAWVLRQQQVTSALVGVSSVKQLEDNLTALNNLSFTEEELNKIEHILV